MRATTNSEFTTEVIDWDSVHVDSPVSRLHVQEVSSGAYVTFVGSDLSIVLSGEALDAVIERLTRARAGAL